MGEKMNAGLGFFFENVLQVSTEYGAELAKNTVGQAVLSKAGEIGANVLIDSASSIIPALGPAITSYRNDKRMRNMEIMLKELNQKQAYFQEKFNFHNDEVKEVLDNIFEMVMEKISNTSQSEKIKYMINGYSDIVNLENPSFDVAYLYFDTLDKLTILDIEALKLSYPRSNDDQISEEWPSSYTDVLERFDIDYAQYLAIRENLYRMGLLENDYDNKLNKDLENIETGIKEIRDVTESLVKAWDGKGKVKIKKLSAKSKVKFSRLQ